MGYAWFDVTYWWDCYVASHIRLEISKKGVERDTGIVR